MTAREEELAKQLHNALMCILAEKNDDAYGNNGFFGEDGEPLYYEEGGNYSAGGIMSGYGEWDFDFREAAEALRGTGRELPAYGDAAKFKINLQQFATRDGADAVMAHLAEALRKEEEGAE